MASIRILLRGGRTAALLMSLAVSLAATARAQSPAPASPPAIENDAGVVPQQIDVPARQVAIKSGRADWQDGYAAIRAAIVLLRAALAKANLKATGAPFAVFTETDDVGFRYDVMTPIAAPPSDGASLGPDIRIGLSPSGKALKFERRGAYDDIDDAYEAIAAYLDEKGLEAKDAFVEEFLTDAPRTDDRSLIVDIYIFVR